MTEERRLVTVVFADVVGSTTLGEQLDAEGRPRDAGLLLSVERIASGARNQGIDLSRNAARS